MWQQRQRSAQLLQIAAEHPTFPIVLEAVRKCVKDVYDLPALVALMTSVQERRIRVIEVTPPAASPFARSLLFGYVSEYLYEGDSPLAERRAAALTLDPSLLGELLGQTDLRDLLEPHAISQVVAQIQHLTEERRARGPEDAVDMLRSLGPLGTTEAGLRGVEPAWLEELEAQRRILRTRVVGKDVWAGVEDAARLRDGLGAPIPAGVAVAHLRPVDDPLADLISRYSRTHGPFTVDDVVGDLGLPPAVVSHQLSLSRAAGRIIQGWFIPDRPGPQWCHPDVLRLIKRRSVAILRKQIEPVSQVALATFLPRWHNIGRRGSRQLRGPDGVLLAIRAMAGVGVPASALEESILPLRVTGYAPAMLDELTSAGEVLWTGSAPLPGGDGWIALAPADVGFLLPRATDPPGESTGHRDVSAAPLRWGLVRVGPPPADDAPRPRPWSSWPRPSWISSGPDSVSNDTIEPLRAMLDRSRGRRRRSTTAVGPRSRRQARGRYADAELTSRSVRPWSWRRRRNCSPTTRRRITMTVPFSPRTNLSARPSRLRLPVT